MDKRSIYNLIRRRISYCRSKRRTIYSFIDSMKEKEIVVWVRLQKNLDKPEIIDFIKKKFNLDDKHAETLYYKALPDGISFEEQPIIETLSTSLSEENISLEDIQKFLEEALK